MLALLQNLVAASIRWTQATTAHGHISIGVDALNINPTETASMLCSTRHTYAGMSCRAPKPDSIYTVFGYDSWASGHHRLRLIPLVLVVSLQLALLVLVMVSLTEKVATDTLPRLLAIGPIPGPPCANPTFAWDRVVLALAHIGALCALALYTHAEAQQAVDLFERLVEPCTDGRAQEGCCSWQLLVPIMQLLVASFTLFVQALVFENNSGKALDGGPVFEQIMDSVFASVTLAFICELDNKAWVLVEPSMARMSAAYDSTLPASAALAQDNVLLLLCQWSLGRNLSLAADSSCCAPRLFPTSSSEAGRRAARCCSLCCKQLLTYAFHVLLFFYECVFAMFLLIHATDPLVSNCLGQLIFAAVLGCACFLIFQVVAGVTSSPIPGAGQRTHRLSRCCTGMKAGWLLARPVVLNLLAPFLVAISSRVIYTVLLNNLFQSKWRCQAGAVLGCNPCNTTAEWCTATAACAGVCRSGPSAAQANSSCAADWCINQACVSCLLTANASMPLVNISMSISGSDLLMAGVTSRLYTWMHVWISFMPAGLIVLLAGLFLWYEGTSCQSQGPEDGGGLIKLDFKRSSLQDRQIKILHSV